MTAIPRETYEAAEKIVQPFLANSAAIFGVQPDHRFKTDSMIVMQVVEKIAEALHHARTAPLDDALVMVPRRPTAKMQEAALYDYLAFEREGKRDTPWNCNTMWRAMLAAHAMEST
jgi:hypothetical protein